MTVEQFLDVVLSVAGGTEAGLRSDPPPECFPQSYMQLGRIAPWTATFVLYNFPYPYGCDGDRAAIVYEWNVESAAGALASGGGHYVNQFGPTATVRKSIDLKPYNYYGEITLNVWSQLSVYREDPWYSHWTSDFAADSWVIPF